MHKQELETEEKKKTKRKSTNFLFLMSFKWTKEEKQHINNIAEQQIKKQVKQMKTESLYNQFNEFSNEFQKKKHIQSC